MVLEITSFCLFRLVSPPVSGQCIPNSFPTEFWLSANSLNFSILPFMKKKNPPSCTAATADRMRSASRHRNLPNKKRSFLLPESDPINFRDSSSSSSSPSSSSGVSYSNADMMEEEKVLQQLHERRLLATAHKPPFPTNKKRKKNTNVRFTREIERETDDAELL